MKQFAYCWLMAILFYTATAQNLTRGEQGQGAQAAKIEYLSTRQVQHHATYHRVNLNLYNKYNHNTWFIVPSYGEDKLGADGKIAAPKPWRVNFITGRTYIDAGSVTGAQKDLKSVKKVHFIGHSFSFYAFLLPPKGKITLKNYDIGTFKDATSVHIIQTEDIKMNGLLPLRDFLLYEPLCSDGAEVDMQTSYWINVDWDENQPPNAWRTMAVEFLKVKPLATQEVKIK